MQGLRGRLHLRAQPTQEHMQGLRGRLHLRAQPREDQMQGLRGHLNLRAQPREKQVQGFMLCIFILYISILTHAPHSPPFPLGLDTATAVEGYMPVARPGAPSVHHLQYLYL